MQSAVPPGSHRRNTARLLRFGSDFLRGAGAGIAGVEARFRVLDAEGEALRAERFVVNERLRKEALDPAHLPNVAL